MRISFNDAIDLFREWRDEAIPLSIDLALGDNPGKFEAVIIAVSLSGRIVFSVLPHRRRASINFSGCTDFIRKDVGDDEWEDFLTVFLGRDFVTFGKRK